MRIRFTRRSLNHSTHAQRAVQPKKTARPIKETVFALRKAGLRDLKHFCAEQREMWDPCCRSCRSTHIGSQKHRRDQSQRTESQKETLRADRENGSQDRGPLLRHRKVSRVSACRHSFELAFRAVSQV